MGQGPPAPAREPRAAPAGGAGTSRVRRAHVPSAASPPPRRPRGGAHETSVRGCHAHCRGRNGRATDPRSPANPKNWEPRSHRLRTPNPEASFPKPRPQLLGGKRFRIASLPGKRPAPPSPAYQSAAADCIASRGRLPELVGGASRAVGRGGGVGGGVTDGFPGEQRDPALG